MSREIKFRVWNKAFKTMKPASSISFDEEGIDGINTDRYERGYMYIGALEIMQYTGLKDKNGKEIYEGDLWIARPGGLPYVVKWYETGWYLFREKTKLYDNADGLNRGEVIGNIYEHPHLLGEKGEGQ